VVETNDNNQLLPLAIAFAEGENGDSWYWFLERLKQMVVKDRPEHLASRAGRVGPKKRGYFGLRKSCS
jgi:hypothetical protein